MTWPTIPCGFSFRMHQPILRIIVALLIGVWSPLCCCQAMAFIGGACDGRPSPTASVESCCADCSDVPARSTNENSPLGDRESHPPDCPSCPSCQALSGEAVLQVEAKSPTLDNEWTAIATIALLGQIDPPHADEPMDLRHPSWWHGPPFLRANREALRWHCALIL